MAVAVASPASAAGLLALLDEDSDAVKQHALVSLNAAVHDHWFEISSSIGAVEALYEDEDFPMRELAAAVASKVFFHLGELDAALTYALGAGPHFDTEEASEYVRTLVARCLDRYCAARAKAAEGGAGGADAAAADAAADPRLVAIVERMVAKCCAHGQYEQAVGVALEARRLDMLEKVIAGSGDATRTLGYAMRVARGTLVSRAFRDQVLRLLIRMYETVPRPDWPEVCQCLMFLDDDAEVARIMEALVSGTEEEALLAYQIAFDLAENELQSFLASVTAAIEARCGAAGGAAAADGAAAAVGGGDAAMAEAPAAAAAEGANPVVAARLAKLRDILSGKTPIALYLDFMTANNRADLQILKNIKGAVDARLSVLHGATILANALAHAGTSSDTFLREHLDWLARATNWAKFSATAGLGVIHRRQLGQARALLSPYLPTPTGSPYSGGGALYALGLVHVNHGQDIRAFLQTSLTEATSPVVQHGACLGLGLAALGSYDEAVYGDIKNVLYGDDAVAGEAAGLAASTRRSCWRTRTTPRTRRSSAAWRSAWRSWRTAGRRAPRG